MKKCNNFLFEVNVNERGLKFTSWSEYILNIYVLVVALAWKINDTTFSGKIAITENVYFRIDILREALKCEILFLISVTQKYSISPLLSFAQLIHEINDLSSKYILGSTRARDNLRGSTILSSTFQPILFSSLTNDWEYLSFRQA